MQKKVIQQIRHPIAVYVLAKNEEDNIERCLSSLVDLNLPVFLLDSGSTDKTVSLSKRFENVTVVDFPYTGHCDAYNSITEKIAKDYNYCIVLDSDMQLNRELASEVSRIIDKPLISSTAFLSRVDMYVDSTKLRFCSLYPNKPFMFSTGARYFEPVGHGERLTSKVNNVLLKGRLLHDDRKPFSRFLTSQAGYAASLCFRSNNGFFNWRDFIRVRFPIFIILAPMYVYFFRLGFLDGKSGIKYALDRLIAESIMFRTALSKKSNNR